MALTNINSTCDTWDFVQYCNDAGIKPIAGVEVRNGDQLLYILLAANNSGLERIHEFMSVHLQDKTDFPAEFPAGMDVFVIYPLHGKTLELLLPHERIGVTHWELPQLFSMDTKTHANIFVIRHPVTVQHNLYYNLHRLLRCIDKNILLSKFVPGAQASPGEVFLSPAELLEHFRHHPYLVTNTYKLMDQC